MDHTISLFHSGVQNLLNNEIIPADAAQDSQGFINQDGKLKLMGGRKLIGADSGTTGLMRGLWIGYKVDGTQVIYRKTETKLQYLLSSVWTDILTGLTSGTEASFANYSSLAGAFTFFVTTDGYWKINNANPGSALQMYDSTKNFHGTILIDKGRTLLWNRRDSGTTDTTGLYGSRIDPQNSTVYTTHTAENLQNGDGATKAFSGTLNFAAPNNCFGVQIYGQLSATKTITAITQAAQAQITAAGHGYIAGDRILIQSVVGMTQLNGLFVTVASVVDANNFTITTSTTAMTAYSSAGTAKNVEVFTDNYNGVLTSQLGGTGTITYVTGAYTVTFNTAPINAANVVQVNYQTENSNSLGITDFTHSGTRVAGEGFQVPQDQGGDPIMTVLIGQDGAYYSLKQQCAYRFALDDTDLNPTNEVYYANMGVPSYNAGVSTQKGILFINTANPDKPEMTVLEKSLISSTLLPKVLFAGFKFSLYDFSDCYFNTYERFVAISCKTMGVDENDTILLCNISDGTVDVVPYQARMFARDSLANLYVGSPLQENVYQIFNGFDDLGNSIPNFWIGKSETYGNKRNTVIANQLKKFRKQRFKGIISTGQVVEVWNSFDDAAFEQIGTIRGDGTYVDVSDSQAIGSNFIGQVQIGGDAVTDAYPYFCELKFRCPKFRKRAIKLVATGIGYFDADYMSDWDIMLFESRLPSRFRSKQKVSLDGTETDQ